MSWVQPNTVSSPLLPSHYAVDTPNNLATEHFDPHRAWATQTTLAAPPLTQGVVAMGELGAPRQLPYSISPTASDTSLNAQEASHNPVDSVNDSRDHTIAAFTCQINLATSSNLGENIGDSTARYEYPPGFNSSFGQVIYHQYTDNSTIAQIGDTSVQPPRDFSFGYTESDVLAQPSGGITQTSHPYDYNNLQSASDSSYLESQPLNELYLGDRQTSSFHAEYPYRSAGALLERRTSALTIQESEVQPSFIISFEGTPLDEDAWSSAAFSSPSLASFNSSPPSTQHDSSALGTPAQGFEDAAVSHAEPLLNHPISYSISDLRHLSNSPAGSDSSSLRRSRRGANTHQGLRVVPSQTGPPSRPVLDDTTAHQIYSEGFELGDVSDCSQSPLTPEYGSTPATSPSTSIGFDYPQAMGVSTGTSGTSTHGNTARGTTPKSDLSHVVPLVRQLSSKSVDGHGQSGGPRHHPYGRSSKMSAHEQVIQFDSPASSASTVGISDHSEVDNRKCKKKSKGSKRVNCDYICPVKQEPCGQSVSREADISRHMQRHRRAEEAMIREGLLSPDQQTNFENLKADEITLCKRCGETLSRKDALRRHLKNAGKACRSFYPEIVITD